MKTTFIYSLDDPRTGEPCYIGKANDPQKRLMGHLRSRNLLNITHKVSWIKSLLKRDLKPVLNIVDEIPLNNWQFWEQHYISLYKSWGFNLTNGTKGGDGNDCWQKLHSEETKKKISLAHLGKKLSKEHKSKLGLLKIGNKNAVGHKGSIRIKKRIFQIDKNKRLVNIWDSAGEVMSKMFNKSTSKTGLLHSVCRNKGKGTYHNYSWMYEEDLSKKYKIGDIVSELELKFKNREIIVYKNSEIINSFKSIHDTAMFFKMSETTISNYIKQQKLLNGFLFKYKIKK